MLTFTVRMHLIKCLAATG